MSVSVVVDFPKCRVEVCRQHVWWRVHRVWTHPTGERDEMRWNLHEDSVTAPEPRADAVVQPRN